MEVRLQQKKDAEIEQKQEQARRGDPVAAVVVGSHEYREVSGWRPFRLLSWG